MGGEGGQIALRYILSWQRHVTCLQSPTDLCEAVAHERPRNHRTTGGGMGGYLIFHQPSRFFWMTSTTAPRSRFISSWSRAVYG